MSEHTPNPPKPITVTVGDESALVVPTVGRVVHLVLDEQAAKQASAGGNLHREGNHIAAIVVRTWSDQPTGAVNLLACPDGPTPFWITSVLGDHSTPPRPRTWHYPERA